MKTLRFALLLSCLSLPLPAFCQEPPLPPMSEEQKEEAFQEAFNAGLETLTNKRFDRAIQAFQFCIRLYPERPTAYYNIGCAYSLMGKKKEALDWIETSLKKGFTSFEHADRDTDLDNIREEPRFKELVAAHKKKLLAELEATAKAELFLPDGEGQAPLIVFLHGAGETPEPYKRLWCAPLKKAGTALLLIPGTAPLQGGLSWNASTETVVLAAVRKAIEGGRIDAKRVLVAGFSAGAYYSLTIAIHHPDIFRGACAFNPAYERSELGEAIAKAKGVRIYLTTGLQDPLENSAREGRDACVEAGIPVVLRRFGGGHTLPGKPLEILLEAQRFILDGEAPTAGAPRGF